MNGSSGTWAENAQFTPNRGHAVEGSGPEVGFFEVDWANPGRVTGQPRSNVARSLQVCPSKIVSSEGCSRAICVQVVYKKAGLKGLKMDLSNAESITDS